MQGEAWLSKQWGETSKTSPVSDSSRFSGYKAQTLLRGIGLHLPAAKNFALNPFQPTTWMSTLPLTRKGIFSLHIFPFSSLHTSNWPKLPTILPAPTLTSMPPSHPWRPVSRTETLHATSPMPIDVQGIGNACTMFVENACPFGCPAAADDPQQETF